jgi:shikimate kinase
MHIALVGLPGSGKSTIGRQLARLCGVELVDVDAQIEAHLGCSIKNYFASHGEEAFRDVESQVLARLLGRVQPCVLATGGGAVLRPENRQALRACSTVFYLQAQPEAIAQRLRGDTVRPLMQGVDALQRLRDLLKVRGPLYEQVAHYSIDTQRQSTAQVARKIRMQMEMSGGMHLAPASESKPEPEPEPKSEPDF